MSTGKGMVIGLVAVALAAAGGYWLGDRAKLARDSATQPLSGVATTAATAAKKAPKLLYYRNPMGLPDTSPVPKKDPMGMDYIPVFDNEQDDGAGSDKGIRISTEKLQKAGVRVAPAQLRVLDRLVRAAGRIEPDERRVYAVAPRFEGYIERLHINVTGQSVSRGQALFEVYSPELLATQNEYVIASRGADSVGAGVRGGGKEARDGMAQLASAALSRLRNWGVAEAQIKSLSTLATLATSGEVQRTLIIRSPASGIVTEKKALQGMRFTPGEVLYQISDLSTVWVIADVFEQDIAQVKPGVKASIGITAYPAKRFMGTVTYVYPTLNAETRTVPVRIELPNPGLLLKPAMFAEVELQVGGGDPVVTVPTSAVIDSGTRRIVLVQTGEGRFEPREVRLGQRGESDVEVMDGVRVGEQVVVAANFLIDAESNLKAAVAGFAPAGQGSAGATSAIVVPVVPAVPIVSGVNHAEGTFDGFDPATEMITLSHGPVASLKWPAMTMEFQVATADLVKGFKPGTAISFDFVERKPGEWLVTRLKPVVGKPIDSHASH